MTYIPGTAPPVTMGQDNYYLGIEAQNGGN